jgi:nitrite reductase/ring-hydroxylating ferredoxin subunit
VTQEPQTDALATRRGVLAGVGLVGLAGAITACGGGSSSTHAADAGASQAATASTQAASGASASASASAAGSSGAAAGALAATSQIPVGSGVIFTSKQVVVTQPVSGQFKAFSTVCTHMGCIVNTISNGTIDCPCHGSQYSIKTGDVVAGPAPKPLAARQIKVTGDSIFLE